MSESHTASLNPQVVDQAVEWLVHLWSGTADSDSRSAWQQWRAADPEHERAWLHIENVNKRLRGRMDGVSADTAIATIAQPASRSRRKALKTFSTFMVVGAAAWLSSETMLWKSWTSEFHTATGEQRNVELADGTQIELNTDTAVNVHYSPALRLVQLVRGELLITTAKDSASPARPFMAETASGRILALGTKFTVRQEGEVSQVAVLEGAVELIPANNPGRVMRLEAGQAGSFNAEGVLMPAQAITVQAAWTEGVLVASDMRLDDFIAELKRYMPGHLSCDPASAAFRLSGVFPLNDTQRILAALTEVLPVRVQTFTRYWTRIVPAEPSTS